MGRRDRRRAETDSGAGPKRRLRRRDWEEPGAVVKGPPITVSCECGEKAALAYGEHWSCPSCGRSYDTTRIPREQYEEIRRLSQRYRALPVAFALGVALLAIFFTLTGNVPGVFFLLPVALIVWFVFLRPVHRKRYRQAISGLPRWQLRSD